MSNATRRDDCRFTDAHSASRRPAARRAPRGTPLFALVAMAVALATLLWLPAVRAQAPPAAPAGLPNEYTVKAVLLYSFGRYVEWPQQAFAKESDPFVIGIVGGDSFAGALDEIAAKKTIQGRPIVVRRFASPEEYGPPCHILFVSRSLTKGQQAAVIRKTEAQPVFVVGETPGFAEQGAIANFFVEEDRIRFEISVDNARRAQLRMDAKLLKLGKPVGARPPAATN